MVKVVGDSGDGSGLRNVAETVHGTDLRVCYSRCMGSFNQVNSSAICVVQAGVKPGGLRPLRLASSTSLAHAEATPAGCWEAGGDSHCLLLSGPAVSSILNVYGLRVGLATLLGGECGCEWMMLTTIPQPVDWGDVREPSQTVARFVL